MGAQAQEVRVPSGGVIGLPSPTSPRPRVYGGPMYFELTGTCSSGVQPTTAVVVGGVAAEGLKPVEVAQQLDKQLDLIRNYVESNHGHLLLFERIRTLKSPPPNRTISEQPYEVIQRLQAEFPADAPMDTHLQRMIELGLDRFGDNVLNANNSRREVVVRFRVADLETKVRDLQHACTVNAWKQWCAVSPGKELCTTDQPPPELQLQTFNVRSAETVLIPNDGANRWRIDYGRNPHFVEPPDLLGNLPMHLDGGIVLTYSRAAEEKP